MRDIGSGRTIAAAALLLCLGGCTTSASVEDADLFSAGNIPRYKREQAEREQRAVDLKRKNETTQQRLDARLAERDRLSREEASLREDLDRQNMRLSTLERQIESVRVKRLISERERGILLQRIRDTKAAVARYLTFKALTANEIRQGRAAVQEKEPLIRGLENLSRTGFRDVTAFVNGLR